MPKQENVKPGLNKKVDILESKLNLPDIPKNISKIDNAVLSTIRLNPLATNGQIASNVVALGASKYPENVYRRIAQKANSKLYQANYDKIFRHTKPCTCKRSCNQKATTALNSCQNKK